jgi:hypothetical protein
MAEEEGDGCSICLDCFEQDSPAVRADCGHQFHRGCLQEWLHACEGNVMLWPPR